MVEVGRWGRGVRHASTTCTTTIQRHLCDPVGPSASPPPIFLFNKRVRTESFRSLIRYQLLLHIPSQLSLSLLPHPLWCVSRADARSRSSSEPRTCAHSLGKRAIHIFALSLSVSFFAISCTSSMNGTVEQEDAMCVEIKEKKINEVFFYFIFLKARVQFGILTILRKEKNSNA